MSGCVPYIMHSIIAPPQSLNVPNIMNLLGNRGETIVKQVPVLLKA